jgi:hypothetical protein
MFKFSNVFTFLLISILFLSLSSCKKDGCTNPEASNYNSEADENDGSCVFNFNDQTEKLVATINGNSFSASFFSVTQENGQYVVSGTDDGIGLSLSLADSVSNGSLNSNTASYVVTGGQEAANSGSYSYSVNSEEIYGTFSFETDSHSLTTGQFRVDF